MFERTLYAKLRAAYAHENAFSGVSGNSGFSDPCAFARALGGPSCASVRARLVRDVRVAAVAAARERHSALAGLGSAVEERSEGGKGSWKRGNRKRLFGTPLSRKKYARRAIPTVQYRPCACHDRFETGGGDVSCGKNSACACSRDGNFCEKWCGCLGRCGNAFAGCTCKQGACRTRACPCFAAQRECDPDLCKRCSHTSEHFTHTRRDGWPFTDMCAPVPEAPAAPTEPSRARARPDERCGNMRVLLRQKKHVQLGVSTVAGWGCFLRDGAAKNDLIGEYVGEIISQKEADARGKIYDNELGVSFLFNLNDTYVLDGHARGNKLKFANHSANPNCYAKVVMVRGDHRVGIFALRDIEPGAELFFDYKYERSKAPKWVDFDDTEDAEAAEETLGV